MPEAGNSALQEILQSVPLAYLSPAWKDNCNVVLGLLVVCLPLGPPISQITLGRKWQGGKDPVP